MKINRKELLKLPQRPWNDTETKYKEILIVPSGLKHDSGYMKVAIIGKSTTNEDYEICAYPDSISYYFPIRKIAPDLEMATVRMDCYYPQGIMRFFGDGVFTVSMALSDVDIRFIPTNPKCI